MKIKILSSKNYENSEKINYGDCIIIDNGLDIVVYDCGSEEHAKEVINYINTKNIKKVKVILSHNDSDHYKGIEYLKANGRLDKVYTVLLLKYLDEILDEIDDGRKNRNSLKEQIKEEYDNIAHLSMYLDDVVDEGEIITGVEFVGPKRDFLIKSTAQQLDCRESDSIDNTTVYNATSVQIAVTLNDKKILLLGDAIFEAFDDKMFEYDVIQLPHHGNLNQAEQIFEKNKSIMPLYIISDNTGNDNGGSDNIYFEGLDKGKRIKNTKNGNIEIDYSTITLNPIGSLGIINEIYNFKNK